MVWRYRRGKLVRTRKGVNPNCVLGVGRWYSKGVLVDHWPVGNGAERFVKGGTRCVLNRMCGQLSLCPATRYVILYTLSVFVTRCFFIIVNNSFPLGIGYLLHRSICCDIDVHWITSQLSKL